MKRTALLTFFAILVINASVHAEETLVAIRRAGGGGWGATTQYGMKFNPATIVTLQGTIMDVRKFTPLRSMSYGYLVTLKTKDAVFDVHIGPGWYVNRFDFPMRPGDVIWVKGSVIEIHGSKAVMAMEVRNGEKVLKLRGDDGVPVWSELANP